MRQHPASNDSINLACDNWTDALYLPADNTWGLGDNQTGAIFIGASGKTYEFLATPSTAKVMVRLTAPSVATS